jgi:hypothetical protein
VETEDEVDKCRMLWGFMEVGGIPGLSSQKENLTISISKQEIN